MSLFTVDDHAELVDRFYFLSRYHIGKQNLPVEIGEWGNNWRELLLTDRWSLAPLALSVEPLIEIDRCLNLKLSSEDQELRLLVSEEYRDLYLDD